jgi:hypothetical protein
MVPALSTHLLSIGIRRPQQLALLLRKEEEEPTPEDTPRSPVGPLVKAAIRRYFREGRDASSALKGYDSAVAKAKRREKLATQFAKGRAMLELFLEWDAAQPAPASYPFSTQAADVLGWSVRLSHDVIETTPDGIQLRLVVTDTGVTSSEDIRLLAVAALLHYEKVNPTTELRSIAVWHLRAKKRFVWSRGLLLNLRPALASKLTAVTNALGGG